MAARPLTGVSRGSRDCSGKFELQHGVCSSSVLRHPRLARAAVSLAIGLGLGFGEVAWSRARFEDEVRHARPGHGFTAVQLPGARDAVLEGVVVGALLCLSLSLAAAVTAGLGRAKARKSARQRVRALDSIFE